MSNGKLTLFKSAFHRPNGMIPLNNAGVSLMPNEARLAIESLAKRMYEEGDRYFFEAMKDVGVLRARLAEFLGAKPDEVIFFPNTATAISQAAFGLKFQSGDEIVVWDQEFPSNFYPWLVVARQHGAKLVVVDSDASLSTPLESLKKKVTPKTRVIATSWVQYRSGARVDLESLTDFARANGIFTVADIIQGAGVLPFDFARSGLDAACGGSHKWLAGPPGVGFMLLKREHMERLTPIYVGAMSFGSFDDLSDAGARLKKTFERFEPGAKNLLEMMALNESVHLLMQTGIEVVAEESRRLARRLAEGLERLGYRLNRPNNTPTSGAFFEGPIINFSPTAESPFKNLSEVEARLQKFCVSHAKRPPGIRLSPHAYNLDSQIDETLDILSGK